MIPRIKEQYEKEIIESLKKKFSMKNKLMVPRFLKVVLNMGLGADGSDKKKLQNCIEDMDLISGQKPVVTKFKKSFTENLPNTIGRFFSSLTCDDNVNFSLLPI